MAGRGTILHITFRTALLLVGLIGSVAAQQPMDALKRNIDIFSGVLEEALELDQGTGLFGMSLGGIENSYLAGQGVVYEIRTPLANRRNRVSLASLNTAMRSLGESRNPFEAMQRRSGSSQQQAAPGAAGDTPADGFYRDMMERIARVDYSLVASTAIQQAGDAARSLRSIGDLDDNGYEAIRNEIEQWRSEMQEHLDELTSLEQEIRSQSGSDSESDRSDLSARLDGLLARIEPLREQALAKAAELKERSDVAEREYAERWQQERAEFERMLFGALCNYGATLRELPDEERISIILSGLGDEAEGNNSRRDKVHIISKSDAMACQSGNIDAATLQRNAVSYSY